MRIAGESAARTRVAAPGRSRMLAGVLAAAALGTAQLVQAQGVSARALITTAVDERALVRLPGNTRAEANARNDRGRVPDALLLEHLQLLLKRPPERQQALRRYIDSLHNRTSPNFHRWLSPAQLAQAYGAAPQDITAVTAWLTQHGFTVQGVYPATLVIDFSGSAGQVSGAFHTEIHALDVRGVRHIANMSDPQVPAALAPVVAGVISLHDFRPHSMRRARARRPAYTTGNTNFPYVVTPPDLATIYNLNPVFAGGNTGQNQTIVVIEDTNLRSTDWDTFRSTFGLNAYGSATLDQKHPAPPMGMTNNCGNPGVNGNEVEAILDAEWASAAAPRATIELASCSDTPTTFGGLIALENLLNESSSPPAIVSISYGECEALNGATANAAYATVYAQAVLEGVSVFVAAGDEGAASCDASPTPPPAATLGINVSGFASTQDNVAVGGTDFDDTDQGTSARYWSPTNSATYGSALSYIPEIPWNDSCASSVITAYVGYATPYGSTGFCNSTLGANFLTIVAGSGGPSGCASGTASTSGVVSGTCQGTPKPSWQRGVPGIPNDGVRDLPDVSLFASNGIWGHYYVYCQSDDVRCTGAPSGWSGAGGTSFAAPILAGFQALVNEVNGSRQGNPNYVYYDLAASQFASGLACSSLSGASAASGCVFYDVTKGDIEVDCTGSNECDTPSGTYGVLASAVNPSFVPAYGAQSGWDFATGIGTINAANLVRFWPSSDVSVSGGGSVNGSGQLVYTLQVANSGPQKASGVVVSAVLPPGASLVTAGSSAGCTQVGQTLQCTVSSLDAGAVAGLTVLVQASAPDGLTLTFTVGNTNGDLNPTNNSAVVSAGVAGDNTSGDGPLPPWSLIALGALLLALALRRRTLSTGG